MPSCLLRNFLRQPTSRMFSQKMIPRQLLTPFCRSTTLLQSLHSLRSLSARKRTPLHTHHGWHQGFSSQVRHGKNFWGQSKAILITKTSPNFKNSIKSSRHAEGKLKPYITQKNFLVASLISRRLGRLWEKFRVQTDGDGEWWKLGCSIPWL